MRHGITGTCKWCGEATVKRPAIYWHPECAREFELHTKLPTQFDFLIERDGERCGQCGCVPMKWQRGGPVWGPVMDWQQDQYDWARERWSNRELGPAARLFDPVTCESFPHARESWWLRGGYCPIERVTALEVDHFKPLWSIAHLPPDERRWYFGPGNLWLLCPACHKAKTKREAGDRARERSLARSQGTLPL